MDLSFLQIVFAWEYWSQDDSSPVSLKSFDLWNCDLFEPRLASNHSAKGYPIDSTADVPFCWKTIFTLHSTPSKPSKLSSIKKFTIFKKRHANLELLDSTSQVSLVELYWCILQHSTSSPFWSDPKSTSLRSRSRGQPRIVLGVNTAGDLRCCSVHFLWWVYLKTFGEQLRGQCKIEVALCNLSRWFGHWKGKRKANLFSQRAAFI